MDALNQLGGLGDRCFDLSVEVTLNGDRIERKCVTRPLRGRSPIPEDFYSTSFGKDGLGLVRKEQNTRNRWLALTDQLLLLQPDLRLSSWDYANEEFNRRD